jgi:hypothetical protein
MVTQLHQGRFVAVRALGLTEEEYDEARDLAADTHAPIPSSRGALITVIDEKGTRSVEVAGLNPTWHERAPDGSPTSPFKGLPIAWSDSGEIWLGAPGWDALTSGGLWHSADAGGYWTQIPDFVSVSSIILLADASVVVAETHVDRWRSFFLEPYPSRVVVKSRDQAQWRPASMPPYGTRSELELCGPLDGRPVVRVDGTVYSGGTRSLWRFLITRSRPVS